MGFSEAIGDVLFAYTRRWPDGTQYQGYTVCVTDEDLAAAVAGGRAPAGAVGTLVQGRICDVVFDHMRGVRDVDTAPLCDPPYLLCWYEVDHEYTGQSGSAIHPKTDLAAALAEAAEMVAREKASGGYSTELIEVYVVRVREVR